MTTTILGIRHHGPGSARSVLAELDRLQPDAVLVEGPSDATGLIPLVADPAMRPPVALLVYAPDEPRVASGFDDICGRLRNSSRSIVPELSYQPEGHMSVPLICLFTLNWDIKIKTNLVKLHEPLPQTVYLLPINCFPATKMSASLSLRVFHNLPPSFFVSPQVYILGMGNLTVRPLDYSLHHRRAAVPHIDDESSNREQGGPRVGESKRRFVYVCAVL